MISDGLLHFLQGKPRILVGEKRIKIGYFQDTNSLETFCIHWNMYHLGSNVSLLADLKKVPSAKTPQLILMNL